MRYSALLTFPLTSTSTSTSLYRAIFQKLQEQSADHRPALTAVVSAIEIFTQKTHVNPGKLCEFHQSIKLLHPHQLVGKEREVVQVFMKKVVDRELEKSSSSTSLIESLAHLPIDKLPPLADVLKSSMDLIALTHLDYDEISTWDFWLRDLYPERSFIDLDDKVAETFEMMTLKNAPILGIDGLLGISQGDLDCRKVPSLDYLKAIELCTTTPATERLKTLLFDQKEQVPWQKAEKLQALLSALMAEKSMWDQLQSMLLKIRDVMKIEVPELCDVEEILSQLWQTDKELLKMSREIQRAESSEEFGLILFIYQQLSQIQAPYTTRDPKMRNSLRRQQMMAQSLHQMQSLRENLEQIQMSRSQADFPMMGRLAQRLANYIDTIKVKLIGADVSDSIGDVFESVKKRVFPHLNMCKQIAPALSAGVEFLSSSISANRALTISSHILKLYTKVEKSQQQLYSCAFHQLRELIDHSQPRRILMRYCQLLIDLPHKAASSALLPELAATKECGEVKSPAKSRSRSPPKQLRKKINQRAARAKMPKVKSDVHHRADAAQSPLTPMIPGDRFPFAYHTRVDRWRKALIPLDPMLFSEYALRDERYQLKMIEQHRFARLADRFWNCGIVLSENGAQGIHQRFIVPAELAIFDQPERGVIIWSVNAQGVCYHRFFHPKTAQEVFETIVFKTFRDADFPELLKSQKCCERPSVGQKWDEGGQIDYDPLLRIATVRDLKCQGRLRLFLIKTQHCQELGNGND